MIDEIKALVVTSVELGNYEVTQQLLNMLKKLKPVEKKESEPTFKFDILGDVKPFKGECKEHDYVYGLTELFKHPEFKKTELTSKQLIGIIEKYFKSIWSDFPTPYEEHLYAGKVRRWVSKVSLIINVKDGKGKFSHLFEKPTPKLYLFK